MCYLLYFFLRKNPKININDKIGISIFIPFGITTPIFTFKKTIIPIIIIEIANDITKFLILRFFILTQPFLTLHNIH